ncbi:MAG: hypothetical protein U0R76_11350 [Candidatus Nanopelagicales bacterium]
MRVSPGAARRLAVVSVAVAALSACGSSAATNAASSAGSTPASSSSPSTATSDSPAPATGGDLCAEIVAQKAQLTSNEMPKLLASGTPAAWKSYLAATAAMNDRLYDAAPDELKGAIDQLRQENRALTQSLEAAGYDIRKLKLASLLAVMNTAEFKKASADLVAYAKNTCSLDLTKA